MASYHVRQRDPLLDQNMQAMLERRGRELLGVGLLVVALCFALMLGSYSPEDPGWMVATDEPAQNMLGRAGAAIASTLIIIGGLGAWGLPVVFGAWGLRFVLHRGDDRALSRVVFALIGVALASIFAATHVPGTDWPHAFGLGGLFGDTALGAILGVAPLQASFGLKFVSLLVGGALLAMGLFVTGFDLREIRAITQFLIVGLIVTYTGIVTLAGRGASGTAQMAVALQDRQRQRREDRAAELRARPAAAPASKSVVQAAVERRALARPQAAVASAAAALPDVASAARSFLSRLVAAPQPQDEDLAPAPLRPAPLRADTQTPPAYGRPASLRAEVRYSEPEPVAPPREKVGLLARVPQIMRRAMEPEPELVEPVLSWQASAADGPSEDRIKARISDVIRSRAHHAAPPLTPLAAAIAKREPPMARPRGPKPLIADTRRFPMQMPPEPPVVAPPPQARPAHSGLVADRAAAGVPAPLGVGAPLPLTPRVAVPYVAAPEPQGWADDQDWDAAPESAAQPGWADQQGWPEDEGEVLDWSDEEEPTAYAPTYAPAPSVHAPVVHAPPVGAAPMIHAPRPMAEPRSVVQAVPKKPAAPSKQAVAEAQPRMRFEDAAPAYELPPLGLLSNPANIQRNPLSVEALEENARMLESVLDDYGVKGEIVSVRPGPVVTMYELEPAPGLKASRVIGLADDIARSMSALSARVSTVPGRTVIGIELPNATREKVVLREILSARDFGDSAMRLPLALGKDIGGDPIVANLAKMPHLLIAGTTGSGKSVAINTMILSLLYKLTPEECRLIMIDPKMLELSVYDGIPHLLSPVVTDPKKAVVALKWVVGEMEERYRKMSKMGVRNIEGYNGRVREALEKGEMFKRTIQTGFDEDTGEPVFETDEFMPVTIPYIVVVVDEMADLMMVAGKEIEACIQRLAQMARASGIHLIMATQRPSVDVITGTIKANFPTRISFQVTSKIDSRTILGEQGAEQLLGMGDMLYMAGGAKITRIHGPFVSDEEVEEIVNHLKSFGPPTYMSGVVEGPEDDKADEIDMVLGLGGGEGGDDALYDQAVAVVAKDRKCSTSYIQRKLGIGYNKAARLVEQMEEQGVVTPANHVGKREILLPEH
jgi:S-DNA-T family DNA segregation ATPase FtsK/SpoIIIE